MLSFSTLLLMYPLVVLSTHRIWNRERIGWIARTTFARVPGLNCEHCNIFWIGLLWAVFLLNWYNETTALVANPVMMSLSVYVLVRAATWFYDVDSRVSGWIMRRQSPSESTAEKSSQVGCKSCQDKSKVGDTIRAHHELAQSFKHRVVFVLGGKSPPLTFLSVLGALKQSKDWYVEVWGTDTTYLKSINVTAFSYPSDMEGDEFKQHMVKHLIRIGNGLVVPVEIEPDIISSAISGLRGFASVSFDEITSPEDLVVLWEQLLVKKAA